MNGVFEGLGALLFFIVVGGMLIEFSERGFFKRRPQRTEQPRASTPATPSRHEIDAFLEPMGPVRRALAEMPEAQRHHWMQQASRVLTEVQEIDRWLQAVQGWAPHQREAVFATAEAKILTRQRLIGDFAREVLVAASTGSPADQG